MDAAAGSRFAGRACFFVLCPAALATAEELPGGSAWQQYPRRTAHRRGNNAARRGRRTTGQRRGTGAANRIETIATSVQETRALQNRSWISPRRNAILISIDTGDILYEKIRTLEAPQYAFITKTS